MPDYKEISIPFRNNELLSHCALEQKTPSQVHNR
jgi:hypothetical protein